MKSSLRAIVALCVLFLVACAAPAPKPIAQAPLILISIDGFRADFFDRGLTPNLKTLAADGVHARAMRPAFPTLTFPNHYTLVTGLYPDHHGIVNNRFTDPVSGEKFVYKDATTTSDPAWWGGEPIWVGAERQGKHAATMFWPGSNVAIDGVRPELWREYDGKVSPDARVDQVLTWLDLPVARRPDLVTLYFDAVDHAGHDHGPDSPEVDAALTATDRAIGRLLDGLKQRGMLDTTNIIVVSDHGQIATKKGAYIILDDIVDVHDLDVQQMGLLAMFAAKPGHEAAMEKALLAPHEHMRCWKKDEIPARLHYGSNPRIPPLVCLADPGWLIWTREFVNRPGFFVSKGEHGYDNADPHMRALFIAHGPAFKRGLVVPEFDNVDVYPLLAKLLGIKPAPNDGNPATSNQMLR
ncbi:MAG: alkaline phosphatase family protein [Proteobacteria bacterium]|uniref:ectonucleotide pyrophosphatase/phosphodiesterase n=1 Tax=Rudaea sp. TaxID=2136325 RepID=UPI001D5962CA|nr:alkaline phosphatase family protein [Pseudomonadota bacterium]MBS0566505.1 alkaline phosphatase family protein [Pseudomonadota bacterium]